MTKTIVVAGYGPGISNAVAERFGREGFAVALVARNADRLATGAKALAGKGVRAEAFPADLGKPDAIRTAFGRIHDTLGAISVIHWNAYATAAGDVLTATPADLHAVLDVATVGLTTAVQAALADLRAQHGAVLVTNGGLGLADDNVDQVGVKFSSMGLSIANAAKHKLVRLLAVRLASEDVYVGEVMVTGMVKGTAYDQGRATIEPSRIADTFWQLYQARRDHRATV